MKAEFPVSLKTEATVEESLTEEQCRELFQRLFPNGLDDPSLLRKLAHDAEVAELQRNLDEAHRESVEEARHDSPPTTVRAYQLVYGRFPAGWPPDP